MILKYLLPVLAVAGVGVAVYTVMADSKPKPHAAPVVEPATAPFASYVAGAGLVEASTENIAVSTPVGGVVQRVLVGAGDKVKAGTPLFEIDDRTVRAELAARKATVDAAKAQLARLKAQPRLEDLPPAEARVSAAREILADLESQLAMWEKVDRRAVSDEEFSKRRFAVTTARARLLEAEADLSLLRAGAWAQDVLVAEAEIASAEARLSAAQVELDRHTVRAPVDGEILKVNVRVGEYESASDMGGGVSSGGGVDSTQIVIGNTDMLHVRVDVDENDAWRVRPGASGKAFVRGNPTLNAPLKFVRFEPYVIPKKSLTGASTERVDTRVLQVVFSFDPKALPVFVGQQMDIFIDAPSALPPAATTTDSATPRGVNR